MGPALEPDDSALAQADVALPDVALPDVAVPDVALPAGTQGDRAASSSVDDAVDAELAALPQRPFDQHAEVFERVHLRLRDALAGIDDA